MGWDWMDCLDDNETRLVSQFVCVLSLTLLCVSHYILGFFFVLDADTLLCGVALVKETDV